MSINLDRFHEPRMRGINDYCTCCGQPVIGSNTKCVDCIEQEWNETIASLTMTQLMDRLDDIFEGNEKSFRWDGGFMELTYYGNEREIAMAKRLLEARGTVRIYTAEDKICVYLGIYKNELELY